MRVSSISDFILIFVLDRHKSMPEFWTGFPNIGIAYYGISGGSGVKIMDIAFRSKPPETWNN